jgi:hypothetical protein
LGCEDGVDDRGKNSLDCVGANCSDDRKSSFLSGVLDGGNLITDRRQNSREKDNEVWLNSCGNLGVFGDGLDSVEGTLSYSGILFVRKLLAEEVDSPKICPSALSFS